MPHCYLKLITKFNSELVDRFTVDQCLKAIHNYNNNQRYFLQI